MWKENVAGDGRYPAKAALQHPSSLCAMRAPWCSLELWRSPWKGGLSTPSCLSRQQRSRIYRGAQSQQPLPNVLAQFQQDSLMLIEVAGQNPTVSTEEAVSRWEKGFGKSCDSQQLLECILTFFPPKALKNNRTFHWIKKYFSIFLWYNFTECTGKWKQNKYQESTMQELPVHFFNVFFINCNFVRCKSSIHRVAVCVNACWLAAAHPYGSSLAENDL